MVYGCQRRRVSKGGLLEMREVSIAASPTILRVLAYFLEACADRVAQGVHLDWHEHVPEAIKRSLGSDFIVIPENTSDAPE